MTRSTPPPAPLSPGALASVLALARDRASEGITVDDLADHAGYSRFHFTRLFSASVRMTPGQYLIAQRIDLAKLLLLSGDDPVIDVAVASGFDSLSSFTRRFGATVGVSPAQLRRLARTVADAPVRPFTMGNFEHGAVRVRFNVPDAVRPAASVRIWAGWFPQPRPVGLPAGGVLVEEASEAVLPLCPGHPWLLANVLPASAEPGEQIAPRQRIVAVHPEPVRTPCALTLHFSPAYSTVPILTALPVLGLPR